MISTTDPRIPPRVRELLERLLRPGESIRRPKRRPIDREAMIADFVQLVNDHWTYRQVYAKLGAKYRCSTKTVVRVLHGRRDKGHT